MKNVDDKMEYKAPPPPHTDPDDSSNGSPRGPASASLSATAPSLGGSGAAAESSARGVKTNTRARPRRSAIGVHVPCTGGSVRSADCAPATETRCVSATQSRGVGLRVP
jgi:hypothetical protein